MMGFEWWMALENGDYEVLKSSYLTFWKLCSYRFSYKSYVPGLVLHVNNTP